MATMHTVFTILCFAFAGYMTLTTSNISATPADVPKPKPLLAKLIHRDSLLPASYSPRDTLSNIAKRMWENSFARFAYLVKTAAVADDAEAKLVPGMSSCLFYVNFSIGEAPVPQLAAMDTGSSILWVKCLPCTDCSPRSRPIFDPEMSSTYAILPCDNFYCKTCNHFNQCLYNVTYVDGPSSEGILSTEQFTFETPDGGISVLSNIIFGCDHRNGKYPDEYFSGVFGLGLKGKASLLYQLGTGSKFSYCTGNIKDPQYSFNHLIVGNEAHLEGYSTPFRNLNGRYYVTLEAISLGGKRLDIDASIFRRTPGGDSGVVVDSGAELTFLPRNVFDVLSKEIQSIAEGLLTRNWRSLWNLCYKGTISQDAEGFPALTFHFANEADLVLDTMSMFIQVSRREFCLAILPSDLKYPGNLSIIGMLAQQYYNVGYDLNIDMLFFQRIDCELLDG